MNVATLVFDQEGVSVTFQMNVQNIEVAEKQLVDEQFEEVWKEQMSREEFDEEIASEWDFESFEVESRFDFNEYELKVDGKVKWERDM